MSTNRKGSKQQRIGEMQQLSAGIRQYLSGKILTLAGKTITADDLLKEIDGYVAQLNTTDAAHANWIAEVRATAALEAAAIDPDLEAFESYLRGLYGASSQTLVSFGLAPRKPRTRTVAEKAETAAKSAATRVARHTLGPRQKAAIHGVAPASPEPAVATAEADEPTR
jgi:hypothetical protein